MVMQLNRILSVTTSKIKLIAQGLWRPKFSKGRLHQLQHRSAFNRVAVVPSSGDLCSEWPVALVAEPLEYLQDNGFTGDGPGAPLETTYDNEIRESPYTPLVFFTLYKIHWKSHSQVKSTFHSYPNWNLIVA